MNVIDEVKKEVENWRSRFGHDICTDMHIDEERNVAWYVFQPQDDGGFVVETDLETGSWRTCGLGKGCIFSDWN